MWRALGQVGLDPEKMLALSPFTLSGGMKRRVAIAGILALEPEILVLDEPMAGLDPAGRRMIVDIIRSRRERQETTVMISHNLKEILPLADKIAILDEGTLTFMGSASQLEKKQELLARYNLEMPEYMQVIYALAARGYEVPSRISNMHEAGEALLKFLT